MDRLAKQLIYGFGFLVIAGGIVWLGYHAIVPVAQPTPTPGPTIQALISDPVQILHYANDGYDIIAHLTNPNTAYGAARVPYTLVVSGADGTEITRRTGFTYVNPLEPRTLVFPLTGISGTPASAQLQLAPAQVQWGALGSSQSPVVQFAVGREQLLPSAKSFRYQATATNKSNFDFGQVDVTVLLTDSTGQLVGAGTTTLNSVIAGEERAFSIDWPFALVAPTRAQVFVTTNVFDNANYIRTHGSPNATQQP